MAIAVVHSGQTGSTASTTLPITSATGGNMLYAFVSQTAAVTAPTVADEVSAWTVEATSGETSGVTASIWFAWKKAVGGEGEIKATPGVGAAVQGITYLEASGAAAEAPEHLQATGKQATSTTHASPEITAAAGDLIFIGAGYGGSTAEAESWNNGMTNVSAALTRTTGGYFVSTEALAAKVFTLTLKVTKVAGLLAVALKPSSVAAAVPKPIVVNRAVQRSANF